MNGDGWDDLFCSNPSSHAVIYSGGPYIPQDFKSNGVEEMPVAGEKDNSIMVWPIPCKGELNIAWRGDMKNNPKSFSLYDLQGNQVANGTVPFGVGSLLWESSLTPAGVYWLNAYNHEGKVIGTKKIVVIK